MERQHQPASGIREQPPYPWDFQPQSTALLSGAAVLIPALSTPPSTTQWSHTASSTPCHGNWTSHSLSAHLSIECKRTARQIETPICTCRTTTHQFSVYLTTTTYVRRSGWITNEMRSERTTLQDSAFSSPTRAPTAE